MIKPAEINSLIKLLDDPDNEIFGHVHDKLFEYGDVAIAHLESTITAHSFYQRMGWQDDGGMASSIGLTSYPMHKRL